MPPAWVYGTAPVADHEILPWDFFWFLGISWDFSVFLGKSHGESNLQGQHRLALAKCSKITLNA